MAIADQLRKKEQALRNQLCPDCAERLAEADKLRAAIEVIDQTMAPAREASMNARVQKVLNLNGSGRIAAIETALAKFPKGASTAVLADVVDKELNWGKSPAKTIAMNMNVLIKAKKVTKKRQGTGNPILFIPTPALLHEVKSGKLSN